jgi:hypothetical protein
MSQPLSNDVMIDNIVSNLAKFKNDPLGYSLWAFPWGDGDLKDKQLRHWQIDVMRTIRDHLANPETRYEPCLIAVASGHGIGKSAGIGMISSWALDTMIDCRCNVTANTESQLRTKTVPEVTKWHRLSITSDLFEYTATSIFRKRKESEKSWRADFIPWSHSNPEAFAGLHNAGKRILVVMDEGSAIDDKIWEVTEGALTDEGTQIIWIVFGNPTRNTGRFRDCFRRFKKWWYTKQIDSRDVEGTNKKLFERWAEQYGEDSDFFKIRVRGQFPSMSARALFKTEDVDAAFGKTLRDEQYSFAPKILACDPAWEGDDELVIGMRQGLKFEILKRLPKNDNDIEIANLIARYEDEHEIDCVNIDGGYGTGIVSAGRTLGRSWNLIWFSGKSSREDCFNKRSEMYINVRDLLKDGMAIPDEQDLYDEMVGCELLPMLDGKYKLPPKADTKAIIGRSPNILDCLALTTAMPVATKSQRQAAQVKAHKAKDYNPIKDRLKRQR